MRASPTDLAGAVRKGSFSLSCKVVKANSKYLEIFFLKLLRVQLTLKEEELREAVTPTDVV